MLSDVPQEFEHPHFAEPVEVVDDDGLGGTGREVEEMLELDADRGDVLGKGVAIEEVPLP